MVTFSKSITTILDNKTAAPTSSTSLSDCATVDTNGVLYMALGYRLTFASTATLGATLRVYGSYDGVTYDNQSYDSYTIPFTAGATTLGHYNIVPSPRYLKALVTNTGTATITDICLYSETQTATT
jgi:hypothetical protein